MSRPISELLAEMKAAKEAKPASETETNAVMIGTILGLVLAVVLTIYRGWALFILWGWFIANTLAPAITISHAIGIMMVASLFTSHATEPKCGVKYKWSTVFLSPIMAVGIGWIAKVVMT